MKLKFKKPEQTKAQLMEVVEGLCYARWGEKNPPQVGYLLNFFTGADLVGIIDDLKRMENNGVG